MNPSMFARGLRIPASLLNDMKSHLSEEEFWKVVEHLLAVGIDKKKIVPPFGKRLVKGWSPQHHYVMLKPNQPAVVTATQLAADVGVAQF